MHPLKIKTELYFDNFILNDEDDMCDLEFRVQNIDNRGTIDRLQT